MADWPVAWKRRLALLGFCTFCLLPTASVLAWALAWRLPNHVQQVSAEVSCAVGWRVTASSVRHLRPNACRLENVVFAEPLTNSQAARCDSLLVSWRSQAAEPQGQAAPSSRALLLSCGLLQVDASRPGLFARLMRSGAEYPLGQAVDRVRLKADRVVLRAPDAVYELAGLTAEIRRGSSNADAHVQFFVNDFPTPEPIQIRLGRNGSTDPPAVGFGVYTGNGPLPASLLSLLLPGIERLGPQSTLHGYVWLFDAPDGRAGEVAGRFDQVSIESLTHRWPAPTLRGTLSLRLDVARFRGGRVAEATGQLYSEAGAVHRRFLQAMASGLGTAVVSGPPVAMEWIPYDGLAAEFRLDSTGLSLRGQCSDGSTGTLMFSRQGLLVRQPAAQAVPLAALVHVLAQSTALQVPATREVVDLTRWLPLPQEGSSADSTPPSLDWGGQIAPQPKALGR